MFNSKKSPFNHFEKWKLSHIWLVVALNIFLFSIPFYSPLAQTPPYTIITTSNESEGVILISPIQSSNQIYLTALDELAEPVFSAHSPVRGFIFETWGEDEFVFYNYSIRRWVTVDSDLTPTDTLGLNTVWDTDYHDVHRFEDGSYLFVMNEHVEMDLSDFGGFEVADVIEPVLLHMSVDETIIREWHGLDHIPVNTATAIQFSTVDYLHWNAFDFDEHGGVLMSFRNIHTIARLSPENWNLDWKLGGPENDFQIQDQGWGQFLNQHDINDLGGGRLLLFDNSTTSGTQPGYSRVVEYEVDTVGMTVQRVWSYSHPEEIYSPAQGSVQRLDNGNTLIAWGNAGATQGLGTRVTEIDSEENIVWEIEMGAYFNVYRARKFPHSEIEGCRDSQAVNYDSGVLIDDGSCYYGVDLDGDGMLDSEGDCDDTDASIYTGALEIPNDGIDQNCDGYDLILIQGCTNSEALNYNSEATDEDGSCIFLLTVKVDMFLHGGSANLIYESSVIPGQHVSFGLYSFTLQVGEGSFEYRFVDESGVVEIAGRQIFISEPLILDVVCFNSLTHCTGCVNPEFADFNPFAEGGTDTEECNIPAITGCTYLEAINFNNLTNLDDGSCIFPDFSENNCPEDIDGDGVIAIDDLLLLLVEWGQTCF